MSSNAVVTVTNLDKKYSIFENPKDRLKQVFNDGLSTLFSRLHKKYYKEFWALKDINMTVHKGEALGIIGKNGAGKSTLLQILCGTLTPSSGEVAIAGRVAALLELGSGFNPEFSGKENVFLNAALLGLSEKETQERYASIIEFADIGDFINQPLTTYSSGMIVRLAFAVIAHVDADILIIDEALAVGDVTFTQKCMQFLRNFMKEKTVIFVTHDTGAITSLCDRAIWIDGGQIKMEGSPKDISEHYLEYMFEQQQGKSKIKDRKTVHAKKNIVRRDQRLSFINHTQYRNDLEIFKFDPDGASFGEGGAQIVNVEFQNQQGDSLAWVVGGENVRIQVEALAHKSLSSVIIGFFIKDHLGQNLCGDNTYLTYCDLPQNVSENERIMAEFDFEMPTLPAGDYSISTAIATGTQEEHIQQHWYHNALYFKSTSSSVSTGLIGIPMHKIQILTESQKLCQTA